MPSILLQSLPPVAQVAGEALEGSILRFDRNFLVTIGIQWLNVGLLTAILIFVLYKPVKKFLSARKERIKNEFESARKEMEEAMDLKEKYERMIADIENEREEILRQAHKKAMEKSDQLIFDARHEVNVLRERTSAELEAERQNASHEMREQIIEIASLMAGRFVEISIDKETQDKYIDQAFADWEERSC